MKPIILIIILFPVKILLAQSEYHFTLNPNIDTVKQPNQLLVEKLRQFLSTKNSNLSEHELWDSTDFDKYKYPYKNIYWIETGWPKKYRYYPTLTAIIPVNSENHYILKLAFMESQNEHSVYLKAIYNIMASVEDGEVLFSSYTNYATRYWQQKTVGFFTYISSPDRTFSIEDAREQDEFGKHLADFFNIEPIPITYYACKNLEEMYQILGFEYNWQMYLHNTGGRAGFNNTLYSGNNRDIYNHEVVHLYLSQAVQWKNPLINEGIATYLGGSSEMSYKVHRANLRRYVMENPEFDFTQHLKPYNQLYIYKDTPVAYTIGALICEMSYAHGGKEQLLIAAAEADNENVLQLIGLTNANLNEELRKMLQQQPLIITFAK